VMLYIDAYIATDQSVTINTCDLCMLVAHTLTGIAVLVICCRLVVGPSL